VLFFNHIPKCAGTTFINVLSACFHNDAIITGDSLTRAGLSSRASESMSLIHLPERFLRKARFIGGHFHDLCRRMRCPNAYAVTILRNPVARFKSLITHALRDPRFHTTPAAYLKEDGALDLDHPDARVHVLHSAMMRHFAMPDLPTPTSQAGIHKLYEDALTTLETYDLVITEDTYDQATAFLSFCLGHAAPYPLPRFNEAYPSQAICPQLPPDLESQLRSLIPWEFVFYDHAAQLAQQHWNSFEKRPFAAVHDVLGRITPKDISWLLDWKEPVNHKGWAARELTADPTYPNGTARQILEDGASLDVPLEGPANYAARVALWGVNPHWLSELRVTVNGTPLEADVLYPARPDQHHVLLYGHFRVPCRPGWTRFSFSHPSHDFSVNRTWLLEMSVHLDLSH